MRPELRWTNLTPQEIADRLRQRGLRVSVRVVRQLLLQHHYVRRQARKAQTMGQHQDRDAQFQNIARLKQEYLDSPNPILSIDTKKKELLGNFYRDGYLYTQQVVTTFDHDFPSAADGKLIPHGIYDVKRNAAYLNVGLSHDTSEFACDSLYQWWCAVGRDLYPDATSILILCDGGGSNSATQYLFKEDLQKLADRLGIEIRVAHYPPYCSKYNPIEHRVFPHVTRACQGLIFTTLAVPVAAMAQAQTRTGLRVLVNVIDKVYQTGRKVAEGFKESMRIVFDTVLPKWNYTAVPIG
jgi:hypothetical protein